MGDEFYSSIKLITGEEVFALVSTDELNDKTILILQNPVIMKVVNSPHGSVMKLRPWMQVPSDDLYIIHYDKVITMTEVTDPQVISIYNSYVEEEDFNECASNICESLETFTSQTQNKISKNRKNREIYWSQYKEFRDSCKLIQEVQSDIVCQVCMEREVNIAVNCGHCFCSECASRCNICPNCRTPVTQKLKLFF